MTTTTIKVRCERCAEVAATVVQIKGATTADIMPLCGSHRALIRDVDVLVETPAADYLDHIRS